MKTLIQMSRLLAKGELAVAAILVATIFGLLMANVISRALGKPLIWTDELAVSLMAVSAFIGASLAVAKRAHMTVGLLPETLAPKARLRLALLTDALVILFLLVMGLVIWNWLDLPGLIRAGSGAALAQETFNFIYTDPTLTLGIGKIWFWLILPISTLTALFHAIAILCEDALALTHLMRDLP